MSRSGCRKTAFGSRAEADERIAQIQAKAGRGKKPHHSYDCHLCGSVHVTSRKERRPKWEIEAAKKERSRIKRRIRRVARAKPISPMSPKRRAVNRERAVLVVQLLQDRPWCEMRLSGCTGRAVDAHERLRRSQGGDILDATDIVAACRQCHSYVTEHPVEAVELGLARWSWMPKDNDEGGYRAAEGGA